MYFAEARMYDAADRSFVAVDPVKGTVANSATLTQYTYVLDNPLRFVDPWGLDAILVNKPVDNIASGIGVEHMGAFFQDADNNWWFFFWGNVVRYEKIPDTIIFENIDTMNEYLYANGLYENKSKPYRDTVYVKGDFTVSHAEATELLNTYNASLKTWDGKGLPNQEYNVLFNNCGQVTLELFKKGTLPSGSTVEAYMHGKWYSTAVIPNWNMINVQNAFYNKASNIDEFEKAMQIQRNKYTGKNSIVQWFYKQLRIDIETIG
jgi:hypothetical protein